ncbi:DNA-processing protein DprA [Paenibacillus agilis]|nr:DNA-processing protein DprA [Paenibacillus agilis]
MSRMWRIQDCLFALHQIKGIGWHTIDTCIKLLGGEQLPAWLDRPIAEWMDAGFKPAFAQRLAAGYTTGHLQKSLELTYKSGIDWITMYDESYPECLKEIHEPPWVLYGRGDWSVAKQYSIAMVGTRSPTVYGKTVAKSLSSQLTDHGLVVVSGLARGIDAVSHEGALNKGQTIAVLGTSSGAIYPAQHNHLADKIAASGLVLTEYPIGTPGHPGMFPRRNRIIAGLSLGTVVVEAAARSGALITAQFALEASRDIFAVPGPVTSPKSAGTFELLKQGAKPVATAGDIVEEYVHLLTSQPQSYNNETVVDVKANELLDDMEQLLLHIINEQDCTLDELFQKSDMPFANLHQHLLSLQIKRRIYEHQPGVYRSL